MLLQPVIESMTFESQVLDGDRLRSLLAEERRGYRIGWRLCLGHWRFQWIHPFKDFNGHIGRVLLAAMLYKLALPHVETAPADPSARRAYLNALQSADAGDLSPLATLWTRRLGEFL